MFLALVLLRNPIVFARAVLRLVQFQFNAMAYPAYIAGLDREMMDEAIRSGLGIGLSARDGVFPRQMRPMAAYTEAHDYARFELYKASKNFALDGPGGLHKWRILFGPVAPAETELDQAVSLVQLAAVCNKITGYQSLHVLGIRKTQIANERLLVFPRCARCFLGLLTDALQGGVRGNESRVLVGVATAVIVIIVIVI